MTPRHILVANLFFAPFSYGGATVVAEQVALELARMGHRITAISLCMRGDLAAYAVVKSEKQGIVNYLINMPPNRTYAQMYDNPEVTARLAELIHTLMPDVVHVHCIQEMGTGIITVSEAAQIPVILSVHDFWWLCERQFMIGLDERYCGQDPISIEKCKGCVDSFWAAKLRFDHLQAMSERVSLVTYPSEFARGLSERSGFAVGRGVVWENGVRLPGAEFRALQAARRVKEKGITFGYLGGPATIKGWPLIKQAFAQVDRDDFAVVLVDGSLDGTWWKDGDFHGLPGTWQVFPRFDQSNMDAFYAQIDVLLFVSQWKETFGLAIREALARGITVIQTDSGGTVEHGAAKKMDLIPIGAPAEALQRQVESMLEEGPRRIAPHPVQSFPGQARQFADLVDQVLEKVARAA